MLKRTVNQTKFKLKIFSRTPILYITTYFIPVFCFYIFGKDRISSYTIEGYSFVDWYLPLYIAVGIIAISVFTVGIDLVSKREKKLFKRIMLTDYRKSEEYLSDILLTFLLGIPLIAILFLEATVVFGEKIQIENLLVIIPTFITSVVSVVIAHFVFNLINNSKIASPLQISIFGFSLFALGIIMPYPILSENVMSFIHKTPYYYINRIQIIFWNNQISNEGNIIIDSLIYLIIFTVVIIILTNIIEKIYDRKLYKKNFLKKTKNFQQPDK